MPERTSEPATAYTREQVQAALNRAADDIGAAIGADPGQDTLINLVVNVGLSYLDGAPNLEEAIEENWPEEAEEVLGWVND